MARKDGVFHFKWIVRIVLLCTILTLSGCDNQMGSTHEETFVPSFAESPGEEIVLPSENETPNLVSIVFFHDTACGSCDGTEEFMTLLSEKTGKGSYKLYTYNIFRTEDREAADSTLLKYGRKVEDVTFPAVLINGALYEGMEAIEQNLQREYLIDAVLRVVYYYRDDCNECIQLQAFVDSLPDEIIIGEEAVPLYVETRHSRVGDNGEKIRAFFEKHDVPEKDQMVPFMVLGDYYLAGADAIEGKLFAMLEKGYGLEFPD